LKLPRLRLPRLAISLDRWDLTAAAGVALITGGIGWMHGPTAAIFLGLVLVAVGFFGAPRNADS